MSIGEAGESFAFIYSVEDPKGNTQSGGVGAQVRAFVPDLAVESQSCCWVFTGGSCSCR